jgi:uncharacterized repeat protein (TIGR03803 family)
MTGQEQDRGRTFGIDLWVTIAAYALALLMIVLATQLHAQTFTVLHNFAGGQDGANPQAGLTMDGGGNLYGTSYYGGNQEGVEGNGTVFKLAHKGSGWTFTPLYVFQGGADGGHPDARVTVGPGGLLYGTTVYGGTGQSPAGTVFNLRPPARACTAALCPWTETVIHSFNINFDGTDARDVIFDSAGNLYGTTSQGGYNGIGAVYELTPSGGSWTENILFNYFGGSGETSAGVILDPDGNLYGTTYQDVYELTAPGWDWQVLHQISGNFSGLIRDEAGSLYGGTITGTIFEMSPSNGGWSFNTLYNLSGGGPGAGADLTMDAACNLYGTTYSGGAYGSGSVFKLTPSSGGWTYTSLHDFCAAGYPCLDGCYPESNVVLDTKGNLYGTASACGPYGDGGGYSYGLVWEITP